MIGGPLILPIVNRKKGLKTRQHWDKKKLMEKLNIRVMFGWCEEKKKKQPKSLENDTNVLCNISTNTKLHCIILIYLFILWIVFFSPSVTNLQSYKNRRNWMKSKAPKKSSCTLTVISVQSLSKLVFGNFVKMYKSKRMEITSAALELKPWWVGKSKEAVKHLENLQRSPLKDL